MSNEPPCAARVAQPPLKDWGIYVYFAADVPAAEMRKAAEGNLLKLAAAGATKDVGITAMIDLPNVDTRFFLMPPRPNTPEWCVLPDRSLPNVNSASIQTIHDFFDWSYRNCPAKKIAFIIWGHGYAIDDFDPRIQSSSNSGYFDCQDDVKWNSEARSGEFAAKRSLPLKLIFDSSHNAVLNNNDFADVVRSCAAALPPACKIAILGFDCCSMAMAEVLCEMEGCAELAVASETGMPFNPWLSDLTLAKLLKEAPTDARGFAKMAVDSFIRSFDNQTDINVQLSACDLTKCQALEGATKELSDALIFAVDNPWCRAAIYKAWSNGVSFDPDGFIDLDCFCGLLTKYMANGELAAAPAVVSAANKLRHVLRDDTTGFIVESTFAPMLREKRISLSTGLSIWFPPWIQDPAVEFRQKCNSIRYFSQGYQRTRFSQATGWNQFLLKLLNSTRGGIA